MTLIGIDPGTTESAYVIWDGTLRGCAILPNQELLEKLMGDDFKDVPMFIEMIASYGMPVGKETFETVFWIGRFVEVWDIKELPWTLVYRQEVKLHHCHATKAKDSNIAQALRDKYGKPGSPKKPGPLFGVKSHIWSALAVATYAYETRSSKA
jgi:hypothetical protein